MFVSNIKHKANICFKFGLKCKDFLEMLTVLRSTCVEMIAPQVTHNAYYFMFLNARIIMHF